ncbi:hypothetical protein IM543_00655 [Massilia sp. UMI-21]|nr:hypothetical protein IM543_00655 [Massilia sp. UMI-21]
MTFPKDTTTYSIGDQITVNGMPLKIEGFLARSSPHVMAKWFRGRLGEPMVETKLENALILGKAQEGYFITIRMVPAGVGTNGTLTVSNLKAAYDSRDVTKTALSRLLDRLPAGSKIGTVMMSADGGKLSKYYALSNNHGEEVNRNHILDLMRDEGMSLQFQAATEEERLASRTLKILKNGKTLFFRGKKKEAVAVIGRTSEGPTIVQVNVISEEEIKK